MSTSRRSFLSLLGVGAASAPLAAKAVADTEIARLAGLTPTAISGMRAGGIGLNAGESPLEHSSNIPYSQRYINVADYVKMFGIPEVIKTQMRDQAKYVHALDIDIANKKSWSMAAKIQHQRDRNYQNQIKRIEESGPLERGKQTVKKFLGFDWPW